MFGIHLKGYLKYIVVMFRFVFSHDFVQVFDFEPTMQRYRPDAAALKLLLPLTEEYFNTDNNTGTPIFIVY